jgi:hypothetical protein
MSSVHVLAWVWECGCFPANAAGPAKLLLLCGKLELGRAGCSVQPGLFGTLYGFGNGFLSVGLKMPLEAMILVG